MIEENKLEIKLSYRFDSFLMYLIQEVTKRPSAEILNFFHELSTEVARIGYEKRTGTGIKKKIDDYFPGSSIPFHMELEGTPRSEGNWNQTTRQYENQKTTFRCEVHVGFPDRTTYMNQEALDEMATYLMERALLGVDLPEVKPFERPEVSSPKIYKKLMDSFAGRPEEPKKPRKSKNVSP